MIERRQVRRDEPDKRGCTTLVKLVFRYATFDIAEGPSRSVHLAPVAEVGVGFGQLIELGFQFRLALGVIEATGVVREIGADVREAVGLDQIASHGGGASPSSHVGYGDVVPTSGGTLGRGFGRGGGLGRIGRAGAAGEDDQAERTKSQVHDCSRNR